MPFVEALSEGGQQTAQRRGICYCAHCMCCSRPHRSCRADASVGEPRAEEFNGSVSTMSGQVCVWPVLGPRHSSKTSELHYDLFFLCAWGEARSLDTCVFRDHLCGKVTRGYCCSPKTRVKKPTVHRSGGRSAGYVSKAIHDTLHFVARPQVFLRLKKRPLSCKTEDFVKVHLWKLRLMLRSPVLHTSGFYTSP